jgi:hypothetical protein
MPASNNQNQSEFERLANEHHEISLFAEFWQFVRENKKWWLIPILTVFLTLSVLIFLSGTAAAPFIYTLF